MPIYLTLYADFECLNIPIENVDKDGKTIIISTQVPVNHGLLVGNHLKVKNSPLRARFYQLQFGNNITASFIEKVRCVESFMSEFIKLDTKPEIRNQKSTESCWLCDIVL